MKITILSLCSWLTAFACVRLRSPATLDNYPLYLPLDKVAEKEGEYFYIKSKFDAGNGNSILLFPQDYFSLTGILEGIMARAGQKSEGFKVNVTMEQKLRWEEAARERDMTMSQMIREAVEMYIAVMKRQKELDKKQNIR